MNSAGDALNVYDEVLYPPTSFPQTHPNRLATIAFLRGLQPAPINNCRVLELGCGVGSNIVGMAFQLPASEFIGPDLARRPIESGQNFVKELGLSNVTLYQIDVCEADSERFGRFDYIIAHGLYSWVPQPVRDALLKLCARALTPHGVAMISYATYPGGFIEQLIRAGKKSGG